ncbi:protein kinase [Methylomonas sp. SURF-2]|uniref:Protein kinase n=1 Tax=Methylomonas subterranea TaxID=2952225 RepID=A0ABT1TI14_9GAMM|nr:protein kinase [Methylomonas sp. SURF-2]MCQ8105097.1 protein kinase [Methylomonas sp. SURF-2]
MSQPSCPACLSPLSGQSFCSQCGWYRGMQQDAQYLPVGTVVNPPYRVARVLGHGGFGITYLGWDANLQIKVAIKEYMPRDFARRDPLSGRVLAHASAEAEFSAGLNCFLDEARNLAKFQQHPGIVSVLAFFPAFGTGYMVMEYVEGRTLKAYLDQRGRLDWARTLDIFMQIMDALRAVHSTGLLHRDVAPDNIYLCGDGRVKLLDFGAARARLGGNLQAGDTQTVLVKPGFAPEEQYRDDGRQGPWSDVYSLAASMYYCLTGIAPPDALDRVKQDTLKPLADLGAALPPAAERNLLAALAVDASQRPQSMEALQQRFLATQAELPAPAKTAIAHTPPSNRQALASADIDRPKQFQWWRWLLVAGIVLLLSLILRGRGERMPASSPIEAISQEIVSPAGQERSEVNGPAEEQQSALRRIRERQEAEQLKQQQEAALKRFEERRRLEQAAQSDKQTESAAEHMRSLCAEWGATMGCQEPGNSP